MINRYDSSPAELMISPGLTAVGLVTAGILVGWLPWQTTMLCVLAAISFWLGLHDRAVGLGLLALTIPMQSHLELGIGSVELTWTKVTVWALMTGWTVALLQTRQRVHIDFVTVAVFFVAGALVLSGWNASDEVSWMSETYRWLVTGLVSSLAFNTYRRGGSPLPFLIGSMIAVCASVTLAAWQVVSNTGPASFDVRGVLRAYGPFTHPNQLAIYLELAAPVFLALLLGTSGDQQSDRSWYVAPRYRPLWIVGLVVALVGLMMSQSRGGLIGMAAGLTLVLALNRPRLRLAIIRFAPLGLVAAVTLLVIAIGSVAAGRTTFTGREVLVTPANFAVQERLAHWTAAVEMAKAHPLVGVGAGNYDANFRDYTEVWRFRIGRGHAHNTYLHMLAQSGVIGLMAYSVLLVGVALIITRSARILPNGTRLALLIGSGGVTAAISMHAIFEYVHVLSLNLQLVVIWAMAIAISTNAWNDREEAHE